MIRMRGLMVACAVSVALVLGAGKAAAADVMVYAAASLKESIGEAAKLFEAETKTAVKFNLGASGTLAKQITEGAPAGLFVSADAKWTKSLKDKGLLTTDHVLLKNELVLVAPKTTECKIEFKPEFAFADAFKGKFAIGDPASVPAGKYAKEALTKLGWFEPLKDRLILSKDVRETMRVVEMAGADLGVVYKTDALLSKELNIVGVFPAETHSPVVYTIGVVKGASEDAAKFQDFLLSPKAADIFAKYGFAPAK